MIKKFVERFEARKQILEDVFSKRHPEDYKDIFTEVIKILATDLEGKEYGCPCVDFITEINNGDYQGTLVYVVGENTYQPDTYWYCRISYGSCSGCDLLQSIAGYSSNPPTKEQIKDYMTLALHIVQRLKQMDDIEID